VKRKTVNESEDVLLTLGQSLASELAEKRHELTIQAEVDVVLRASISAALLGIRTYLAVLSAEEQSPVTQSRLAQAVLQCQGTTAKLRRRVARSIARLCRHLSDAELIRTAECVVAFSS
jgi:hypothetical protein